MPKKLKFDTDDGPLLRSVVVDGEPYWVLRDVQKALQLTSLGNCLRYIDADERKVIAIQADTGRKVTMACVNEAGLYRMLLKSPRAKEFQRYVAHKILPEQRASTMGVTQVPDKCQTSATQCQGTSEADVDASDTAKPGATQCGTPEADSCRTVEQFVESMMRSIRKTPTYADCCDDDDGYGDSYGGYHDDWD